jgi:hypothetical protein
MRRLVLGVQLIATLLVLASPLPNRSKALVLLILWAVTFKPIARAEVLLFAAMCALFTAMNAGALAQGVFRFSDPDVLGMPSWEFFMWGFYILHLLRVVQGPVPIGRPWVPLVFAVAFAVPFSTVPDPQQLLLATAAVLALALLVFHERHDFLYAGYMLLVGALVEYTGVWSGQWSYPANPSGGVPLWFITMWCGVGLFTRRLVLPWLRRRAEPHAFG